MKSRRVTALAVAALASVLAAGSATPVARAGHSAGTATFDLSVLPAPSVTGKEMVDNLETFTASYPARITGTPTEILAGQTIEAEMKALGYATAVVPLPVANQAAAVTQPVLKAVTATKRGVWKPEETIMIVGHYDTIASTVDGAYDNGSGTNLMRSLAKALATVPTNRTVTFAWYNGEEEGVLASDRHAEMLLNRGDKIVAVLGFDMVGIAWPLGRTDPASCLCMWYGNAAQKSIVQPVLEHVNYKFLGFPKGSRQVSIEGANTRNSDESSFHRRGFTTLRWAGMKTAGSYPAYHKPDDTVAKIYEVAGGRTFFEQGSLNTLKSAYYSLLTLDNHRPAVGEVTVDQVPGSRDVSVAVTAVDADGPVGAVQVDFGDGTVGPTGTHTYASSGTYTVTVTVADNLWPAVTASRSVTVTVG